MTFSGDVAFTKSAKPVNPTMYSKLEREQLASSFPKNISTKENMKITIQDINADPISDEDNLLC